MFPAKVENVLNAVCDWVDDKLEVADDRITAKVLAAYSYVRNNTEQALVAAGASTFAFLLVLGTLTRVEISPSSERDLQRMLKECPELGYTVSLIQAKGRVTNWQYIQILKKYYELRDQQDA